MQEPSTPGAGGDTSELRSDAQKISSTAANRIHSEVDARKGAAADQARSVSSAIERAAGELDGGAPNWLKSAFQQSADQVQRFADSLEQKDSREILNEVQSFARERPGTFLAACAAVGFAAARVLKAGGEQQGGSGGSGRGQENPGQPWRGQEQSFAGAAPAQQTQNDSFGSSSAGGFGGNAPSRGEFA